MFWPTAVGDVLRELCRARLWTGISSEITAPVDIANDFFGINIAPSSDASCDDYIVERLQELGIEQVRMDFSYCSRNGDAERLLNRVLEEGKQVFLRIFPLAESAKKIAKDSAAQEEWRAFVADVFSRYHDKVSVFELACTPNRGKWSGFGNDGFLAAWKIARAEAGSFDMTLAGPNVSDFEPLYNLLFLSFIKRYSQLPDIHTDNLFVERVIEPESYDHRVLGRMLERPLAFNLVKKARTLKHIGQAFGIDKTICTYNCWTSKRLNRKAADPEQKKADYLLRYLVLAAASQGLERVYWGPLICSRDGIIDCGAEGYPKIDNVSFYKEIRGEKKDFVISPAFYALQQTVSLLSGSRCEQAVSADNGINHFAFTKGGSEFHIAWCRDGQVIPLSEVYPEGALLEADVAVKTVTGEKLNHLPEIISEQPTVFEFSEGASIVRPDFQTLKSMQPNSDIMRATAEFQSVPVSLTDWRGALILPRGEVLSKVIDQLKPETLLTQTTNKVLRDTRNKLWTVDDVETPGQQLTVKLNRAKGIKRFTYRFTDSKGKRHWDNASHMLRCGINTPEPVAYFERYNNSGIEENYYVCRYIENTFSARDVFTAFNRGEDNFRGFSKDQIFADITRFIFEMHSQRIIHRDLSSGNLMMAMNDAGTIDMYMIDIGRAKIGFKERLTPRQRFIDLMRICYKLEWPDRELFIGHYNRHYGGVVSRFWRWPIYFYEAKQTLKKKIKGKRKKRSR